MSFETDEQGRTFIAVVSWLFLVIGGYFALESAGSFIAWTFFFSDEISFEVSWSHAVASAFGFSGFLCGRGMLNRSPKALGASIAVLWGYVIWMLVGYVWAIFESVTDDGYQSLGGDFETALTVSSYTLGVTVTIACIWLARRLSSPSVRHAYKYLD